MVALLYSSSLSSARFGLPCKRPDLRIDDGLAVDDDLAVMHFDRVARQPDDALDPILVGHRRMRIGTRNIAAADGVAVLILADVARETEHDYVAALGLAQARRPCC